MTDEPKKISANRQKKIETVANLSDKFGKAKAVVFTNYQGLTHKQIEALKKELKASQSEFVVAKNSLLSRAIDQKHKLDGEHELSGQTGTLFLYEDVISPLKALAKTIKELNLPNVRFGIMDGEFVTGEQVLKLSTLPSREVLLTQLVFGLKSPISGLHRALHWNLGKLVATLNEIAGKKPAEAKAPASQASPEPLQAATKAPTAEPAQIPDSSSEPEPILKETVEEKIEELPDTDNPTIEAQADQVNAANSSTNEQNKDETKTEGGEN